MPSVASQTVLLTTLFFGGLFGLRHFRERLPRWAWVVVDFVPVGLVWCGVWLGGLLFHDLSGVKFTSETLTLLWAGAQLLALIPALFWGRIGALVSGVWLCLVSLLVMGDVWYFRFFGGLPSVLAFGSGGQIWEVRDSAADVLTSQDFVLLLLVLVGIGLATMWPVKRVVTSPVRAACAGLLALTFWIGAQPLLADADTWLESRYSWKVFSSGNQVREAGLWGAHARETARSARELWRSEATTPERFRHVVEYHRKPHLHQRSEHFGHASGSNVLLVQVEAMQDWVLHARVGDEPVMPFLNELRQRGVYYQNVWDLTGGSPTSDCEYMVLNSQHVLQQGAVAFRRANNDFVTVPTVLRQHGYTTFSAHGFSRSMWNRSVLHPRYGFAASAFVEELGENPKLGWGLSDRAFFDRAVTRLQELEQPWFGFLITLTSHHPYSYIPKNHRQLKLSGMGATLEGYLHSMRYVDTALKQLFDDIEQANFLDNTVVVIYGDHDSKIKFGGAQVRAAQRQLGLPNAVVGQLGKRRFSTKKVPLLIVPPKFGASQTVTAIGGQIDIGPTVLDWLGHDKPSAFIGRVLADDEQRNADGCTDCNMAVRYDGSAVTADLLWDATSETCHDRAFSRKFNASRCASLRSDAEEQLSISWEVTLNNLASRLVTADQGTARQGLTFE